MSALGAPGQPDLSVGQSRGPVLTPSQAHDSPSKSDAASTSRDISRLYKPIGTPFSSDPGQFFRFLTLNVNGLDSNAVSQDVENLLRLCRKGNAHYVGFCETNVDFTTPRVRHAISSTARNSEPAMKCTLACSDIKTGSVYKPGGIATFARDKGFHRTSKILPDKRKMGRYTVGLIAGNGKKSIAAFTIYQCGRGKHGPRSIFSQQQAIIVRDDIENDDPRELLWEDLGEEIRHYRGNGCLILLMGDFNCSLYSERDRFKRFCADHNLVDPMASLMPDEKNEATFLLGSNRIDYILIEQELLQHVRGFGLTGITEPFISDHRAVFLDIDFGTLLRETMAPLVKSSRRMVTSKVDVRTKKFITLVGEAMRDQRILERCSAILNEAATIGPVDSVGKAFTILDRDF